MSKRTNYVELEFLETAPLPTHAATYTVIPHKRVNDKVAEELSLKGFDIDKILYKANAGAQIASGTVLLRQGTDNEMRMMLTWANSYDKSMRFKCAIGGYLPQSGSILVSGNMGTWGRKHTGNADREMEQTIQDQLASADTYYSSLVSDKAVMKNIILDPSMKATVLGVIYFQHGLLNSEQTAIIKQEMKKPSFTYNADKDSLWTLYCHIIFALQKSHPKRWLDQQRLIHFFVSEMFNLEQLVPYTDAKEDGEKILTELNPNQLNTLDEIAKAESE
jgi:hypothetical protein